MGTAAEKAETATHTNTDTNITCDSTNSIKPKIDPIESWDWILLWQQLTFAHTIAYSFACDWCMMLCIVDDGDDGDDDDGWIELTCLWRISSFEIICEMTHFQMANVHQIRSIYGGNVCTLCANSNSICRAKDHSSHHIIMLQVNKVQKRFVLPMNFCALSCIPTWNVHAHKCICTASERERNTKKNTKIAQVSHMNIEQARTHTKEWACECCPSPHYAIDGHEKPAAPQQQPTIYRLLPNHCSCASIFNGRCYKYFFN